ncbi:MAG: imidazolonepropionase [Thermomicrobiales bacterium]
MTRPRADLIVRNASELLTCAGERDPGIVREGALAVAGDEILVVGTWDDVAAAVDLDGAVVIDAGGNVVMPGFVDCHTHVVFGGSRVDEYSAKLTGGDLNVLRAAGVPVGIVGTVDATRRLGVDGLVAEALPRVEEMLLAGTTTIESKSGYGLETAAEIDMLRAGREIGRRLPVDIVSTFLGAHAVPVGVDRARYVDMIVSDMIPRVADEQLAEFCDVYCEPGYFDNSDTERILEAGLASGLRPKIHVDQYSHTGAAGLVAKLGCVSADHLNYTTPEEMKTLARAGVVGVLMPSIDFAVDHPRLADGRAMLTAGMRIALATDICPGGWMPSMQLVVALGCRFYRLSPGEAILAATRGAAEAVGRGGRIGTLAPGALADIIVLDVPRHEDIAYRFGRNAVRTVVKSGRVVVEDGRLV